MKKNMMIYAALAAGVIAVIYFLKGKKSGAATEQQKPLKHSRHLTEVFSKAKQPDSPVI